MDNDRDIKFDIVIGQHCPTSSKFDMWVNYNVPTLKNF